MSGRDQVWATVGHGAFTKCWGSAWTFVGMCLCVSAICCAPNGGGERNSVPYRLAIESAVCLNGRLTIDLSIQNTSRVPIGWDEEFAVGIRYKLNLNGTFVDPVDGSDVARSSVELAKKRFVVLAPGEKLMKRIELTKSFRGFTLKPIAGPQWSDASIEVETYKQFQISKGQNVIDLVVEYELRAPTFSSFFQFEPTDVSIWWIGKVKSNSVHIKCAN